MRLDIKVGDKVLRKKGENTHLWELNGDYNTIYTVTQVDGTLIKLGEIINGYYESKYFNVAHTKTQPEIEDTILKLKCEIPKKERAAQRKRRMLHRLEEEIKDLTEKLRLGELQLKATQPVIEVGDHYISQHSAEYLLIHIGNDYSLVNVKTGRTWAGNYDTMLGAFNGSFDEFTKLTN